MDLRRVCSVHRDISARSRGPTRVARIHVLVIGLHYHLLCQVVRVSLLHFPSRSIHFTVVLALSRPLTVPKLRRALEVRFISVLILEQKSIVLDRIGCNNADG